jgi:hypothetical protein
MTLKYPSRSSNKSLGEDSSFIFLLFVFYANKTKMNFICFFFCKVEKDKKAFLLFFIFQVISLPNSHNNTKSLKRKPQVCEIEAIIRG